MKKDWHHLDKFRGHQPPYISPDGATYGAFQIKHNGTLLNIIATDGLLDSPDQAGEWEHVSVHAYDPVFKRRRIPKWEEMCFIKELFWDDDEVVMQLHPAKKDYVNVHECVLHLWRPKQGEIPTPPKICV
jgi:hypothetical protein